MQDFELIDSIVEGNQKDFELLIKKYDSNVFRVAIGLLHNKEDAEELTQDVFLKVYHSLSTFNKKSAFTTWLYRLTINSALNSLRKKKRKHLWTGLYEIFQISSPEQSALNKMINRSKDTMIRQAIDNLPYKQRLAFVLTKYEELPQREVAAIMELTEGAIEQLVLRAKNNLRKKLAPAIGTYNIRLSKYKTSKNEE
ncbi:MAG: RNA polymerase sigma factor [Candidatus Dadabacteria bacterium]